MSLSLFLLLVVVTVLFSSHPLQAQRVKETKKVDGSPRVNREKRVQTAEPQKKTVRETNQAREKVRKEAETKPSMNRNLKSEGDSRKKQDSRKALPIIEGRRRDQEVKRVPERAIRERTRDESIQHRNVPEDTNRRVQDTLEKFRRDWVNGDSRSLTGLMSGKSRVKITIESKDINDSFGKGQAQYVLKEYLSSADIREMSFSRFRISSSDERSAYGVGKLQMRDRKTGRILDHTVFVSMEKEGESWAVREIRVTE
jgi:hypothetical protein